MGTCNRNYWWPLKTLERTGQRGEGIGSFIKFSSASYVHDSSANRKLDKMSHSKCLTAVLSRFSRLGRRRTQKFHFLLKSESPKRLTSQESATRKKQLRSAMLCSNVWIPNYITRAWKFFGEVECEKEGKQRASGACCRESWANGAQSISLNIRVRERSQCKHN